jgi:hypothetical protein
MGKKVYTKAEVEIILFDDDIITTLSGEFDFQSDPYNPGDNWWE